MCKHVPETVQWIKILWKKSATFQTNAQKFSKVHFIQEPWCSNQDTGRFDVKLGGSRENRESWQVFDNLVAQVFSLSNMAAGRREDRDTQQNHMTDLCTESAN